MDTKKHASHLSATPASSNRRTLLKASVGAASLVLGAPLVRAQSTQRVVVRSLGGVYQDAMKKAIHDPFTKATGIEVVLQTATAGQVLAMAQAGRISIDVVDIGMSTQLELDKKGLLEPLAYDRMHYTRPDDIYQAVRRPNAVGSLYFASVIAYNTQVFPDGKHPKTWAEFWDVQKFPGARTLASQTAGSAPLEFASLAAGKPMDKLYPIDLDAAFDSLTKVKSNIVKFWDTGAVSTQLLERKEAVLGAVWNGRVQDLIDGGAPYAIEWNQARREIQSLSILKKAPNTENAQKYIDFALQPSVQADVTRYIAYGPTNREALKLVRPEDARKLVSEPSHYANSFDMNYEWWRDNLDAIGRKWQSWILAS
jgi:putative spermidine/putrescine transport system substrate-binding protein